MKSDRSEGNQKEHKKKGGTEVNGLSWGEKRKLNGRRVREVRIERAAEWVRDVDRKRHRRKIVGSVSDYRQGE